MSDLDGFVFTVDPITLSTEVVGEVMDRWEPTPITIYVPSITPQGHLDAIASVLEYYSPTIVRYLGPFNECRVYVTRTGVPIHLDTLA